MLAERPQRPMSESARRPLILGRPDVLPLAYPQGPNVAVPDGAAGSLNRFGARLQRLRVASAATLSGLALAACSPNEAPQPAPTPEITFVTPTPSPAPEVLGEAGGVDTRPAELRITREMREVTDPETYVADAASIVDQAFVRPRENAAGALQMDTRLFTVLDSLQTASPEQVAKRFRVQIETTQQEVSPDDTPRTKVHYDLWLEPNNDPGLDEQGDVRITTSFVPGNGFDEHDRQALQRTEIVTTIDRDGRIVPVDEASDSTQFSSDNAFLEAAAGLFGSDDDVRPGSRRDPEGNVVDAVTITTPKVEAHLSEQGEIFVVGALDTNLNLRVSVPDGEVVRDNNCYLATDAMDGERAPSERHRLASGITDTQLSDVVADAVDGATAVAVLERAIDPEDLQEAVAVEADIDTITDTTTKQATEDAVDVAQVVALGKAARTTYSDEKLQTFVDLVAAVEDPELHLEAVGFVAAAEARANGKLPPEPDVNGYAKVADLALEGQQVQASAQEAIVFEKCPA